jgi:hypothetical protein
MLLARVAAREAAGRPENQPGRTVPAGTRSALASVRSRAAVRTGLLRGCKTTGGRSIGRVRSSLWKDHSPNGVTGQNQQAGGGRPRSRPSRKEWVR